MQPGSTVTPGQEVPPQPEQPQQDPNPATPTWQYAPADQPEASVSPEPGDHDAVIWSAREYDHKQKSPAWYMGLLGITIVLAVVGYLLTKDYITLVAIALVAALFGVGAARPPRTLNYQLDDQGITVGNKHYTYTMFKSFGVVDEADSGSVVLVPIKRFSPTLTLYYQLEMEEDILECLGDFLPFEHRDPDLLDILMRRIGF